MALIVDDKILDSLKELSKEVGKEPQELFNNFLKESFQDWHDVFLIEHRLETAEGMSTLEDFAKKNNLDY